ncbi:hypothetical protein RvY_02255 [Ramazzottius varieornatus]|uniref:Uncharacterized protein n=1 Tax=Ramazzottius varieornatus TaxID=947166 RepID=A0A1D1UJ33_RAMVA|nr:hypothetical protein RvY_02255 [Ramazzottius varieornatus]
MADTHCMNDMIGTLKSSRYEVAVAEANHRYGHLFRIDMVPIRDLKVPDCPDTTAEMCNLFSKSFYSNMLVKDRIVSALSDKFRAGTPADLRNEKKYPTVLSMSASDGSVGLTFVTRVLNEFKWTNVFLLCDTSENSIYMQPFYMYRFYPPPTWKSDDAGDMV